MSRNHPLLVELMRAAHREPPTAVDTDQIFDWSSNSNSNTTLVTTTTNVTGSFPNFHHSLTVHIHPEDTRNLMEQYPTARLGVTSLSVGWSSSQPHDATAIQHTMLSLRRSSGLSRVTHQRQPFRARFCARICRINGRLRPLACLAISRSPSPFAAPSEGSA